MNISGKSLSFFGGKLKVTRSGKKYYRVSPILFYYIFTFQILSPLPLFCVPMISTSYLKVIHSEICTSAAFPPLLIFSFSLTRSSFCLSFQSTSFQRNVSYSLVFLSVLFLCRSIFSNRVRVYFLSSCQSLSLLLFFQFLPPKSKISSRF